LLTSIWDAGILTCNSCQENEPGTIWIEFYSLKDAEKFLITIIESLEEQIRHHPQKDDWLCYRILGYSGDSMNPWRYDAHPNIECTSADGDLFPRDLESCKLEFTVSIRFPVEDYSRIIELIEDHRLRPRENFEDLSDDQWNYIKRYLPPQPLRGRRRADDRRALNAILFILKTKCPWRRLPSQYGSSATARRRMEQWSSQGILDKILKEIEGGEENTRSVYKEHENLSMDEEFSLSVGENLRNRAEKDIALSQNSHHVYGKKGATMPSI